MHPLIVATSVVDVGSSRQIAQVKLLADGATTAATSTNGTFAAGFKFMLSVSSSSSSSSTMSGIILALAPTLLLLLDVAAASLVDGALPLVVVVEIPPMVFCR
jgi:hypothetical protein